jgi:hypothetical protein
LHWHCPPIFNSFIWVFPESFSLSTVSSYFTPAGTVVWPPCGLSVDWVPRLSFIQESTFSIFRLLSRVAVILYYTILRILIKIMGNLLPDGGSKVAVIFFLFSKTATLALHWGIKSFYRGWTFLYCWALLIFSDFVIVIVFVRYVICSHLWALDFPCTFTILSSLIPVF